MSVYDHIEDLELALYGDDAVVRDSARGRLAERATPKAIEELIEVTREANEKKAKVNHTHTYDRGEQGLEGKDPG